MKKGYRFSYKYPRTYTEKMKEHLDAVRPKKGNPCYENLTGRPTKEQEIKDYKKANPEATRYRCSRDLGIDPKTVKKWWD